MHTAVKIAPQYDNGVVHVLDASRSVTVAGNLLSDEQKKSFLDTVNKEYIGLKETFDKKKTAKSYLTYEASVANKVKIDWSNYQPVNPSFTGAKTFNNFDVATIAKYIDWGPFFIAWEMHGKFPQILTDAVVGKEATKLYNDANALLKKIIEEKWFTADGVIGFWPASSNDRDTITVQSERGEMKLESLRQQIQKAPGQPNFSLADFINPNGNDYIGAFAVTIKGMEPHRERFMKEHDEYNKIMVQILSDRLVEAFAECLHERVRKEYWGYAKDEGLSNEELIKEEYRGIRPAPGYPACPEHTEKYKLFELLDATKNTGIELTESLAMNPAASVCGWYFAHPQSQYFGIGKIQRDQLEDYAKRKGMTIEDAERWLRPVLE
jgi:5-methyltetrahydrofolate--homocysteine methyltransferase